MAPARPGARSLYSRLVNDAFNWWMLIVGLVVGAGLVWLVLADGRRHDADVAARERASEARWIAETLRATGRRIDADETLDVLRLHEAYLAAVPPDELDEDDALAAEAETWAGAGSVEPPTAPPAWTPVGAPSGGRPPVRNGRSVAPDARAPMAHPISTGDVAEGSTRDR
jgi:hypothetical protein